MSDQNNLFRLFPLSDLMVKCAKEKVEISIHVRAEGDYEIEITPWAPTKFTSTSEPIVQEDILEEE